METIVIESLVFFIAALTQLPRRVLKATVKFVSLYPLGPRILCFIFLSQTCLSLNMFGAQDCLSDEE